MAQTTDEELVSLIGLWTTEWHATAASPLIEQGSRPSKAEFLAAKIVEFYQPIIASLEDSAWQEAWNAAAQRYANK